MAVASRLVSSAELDLWPRYKEAVMSGAYDPGTGRVDVEQHATEDAAKAEAEAEAKRAREAAEEEGRAQEARRLAAEAAAMNLCPWYAAPSSE